MRRFFKHNKKQTTSSFQRDPLSYLQRSGRFYGVKLKHSGCKACAPLVDETFLFKNAPPRLPVMGCDAYHCACEYVGVPNRRLNSNRRSGFDRLTRSRMRTDRRMTSERRSFTG